MTPEQIEQLGPDFAHYLQQFLFCCDYTQTFDLLGVYCRGLLSDLDRKSCEPIALAAGIAVRTLQEFLRDYRWSFADVRDALQRHVATALLAHPGDGLGTIGLIDETATRKKGTQTPGVQRQHCGELGKIDNCIVTVHLGVARGRYKTLCDADLFLPRSWDDDRDRCRQAGIPDELHYRPKWQIALEQVDRALANGVTFDGLTFDEGYGDKPGFLAGLDERRLRYVGEVPRSLSCFTTRPRAGRRAIGRTTSSATARCSPASAVRGASAAADVGGPGVGGEGGAGLAVVGRPADRPHLLVGVGAERADGGGEVLRVQRPAAGIATAVAARGVHALERGTQLPVEQGGDRLSPLRGAELRGAAAPPDVVLRDADVRGRRGGPVAGGKTRR